MTAQTEEKPPTTPEAVPPPAVATTETPKPDEPLGDPGMKALAAERKARKAAEKAATDAQALVSKFEDQNRTELEKATAKATEAETQLAKIQAENLRMRVSVDSEVPAELREFLTGDTEEELTAQAEKLKAAMAAKGPRLPAPDSSQGARPGPDDTSQLTDADMKLMSNEAIVKAKKSGRFDDMLGTKTN